ncbi:hypothetical protein X975_05369, partial [Stegodyphus mimosarum]
DRNCYVILLSLCFFNCIKIQFQFILIGNFTQSIDIKIVISGALNEKLNIFNYLFALCKMFSDYL